MTCVFWSTFMLSGITQATDTFTYDRDSGKVIGKIATISDVDYFTLTLPARSGATFAGSPSPTATIDTITYTIEASAELSSFNAAGIEITPAPVRASLHSTAKTFASKGDTTNPRAKPSVLDF